MGNNLGNTINMGNSAGNILPGNVLGNIPQEIIPNPWKIDLPIYANSRQNQPSICKFRSKSG